MSAPKQFLGRCKTLDGETHNSTPHRPRHSSRLPVKGSAKIPESTSISISVGIDSEWVTRTDPFTDKPYNQILSYQLELDFNSQRIDLIRYTTGRTKRHRLTLERLLELGIRKAIKLGVLPDWPQRVTVFCHFLRADITAFDNFLAS